MCSNEAQVTMDSESCRQADGLVPLIQMLRGGPRNEAAACSAEALASVVANNGINQDAAADAGSVEAVAELLAAAVAVSADNRYYRQCVLSTAPNAFRGTAGTNEQSMQARPVALETGVVEHLDGCLLCKGCWKSAWPKFTPLCIDDNHIPCLTPLGNVYLLAQGWN